MIKAEKRPERTFDDFDQNGDGAISREEWEAMTKSEEKPERTFDDFDLDSDGQITSDEADWLDKVAEFDQDEDGAISREEWEVMTESEEKPERTFDDFDLNSDGQITSDEVDWFDRIAKFDKNGDAAISREEWEAMTESEEKPERTFDDFDLNSDGQINL